MLHSLRRRPQGQPLPARGIDEIGRRARFTRFSAVLWVFLGLGWVLLGAVDTARATTITKFTHGISRGSGSLAPGPDGNVWFVSGRSSRTIWIGRITPSGAVAEFDTGIAQTFANVGIGVEALTAGPDGNMWFLFGERGGGGIAHISPSGTTTVVHRVPSNNRLGAPRFGAADMVLGPDGNLWFASIVHDRIGRVTPSGDVTWFTAGITPNSGPADIVQGPDGNLWFTEVFAARIARITPSGNVTEFRIPTGGEPDGLAVGPDGNLWFADSFDRIGRITPFGKITLFSKGITRHPGARRPSTSSVPGGIAAGPDGNLWFAETNGLDGRGAVGRITPSGRITEFSVGSSGPPTASGMVAGPDGNLWFTYARGGFGRVTPSNIPPPRIAIITREARIASRRTLRINLKCGKGAGRCVGDITVSARTRAPTRHSRRAGGEPIRVATGLFSVDARRRASVKLRLSRAGRRLLAQADQARISVRVRATTSANTARRNISITRPVPRRHRR